MIMKVLLDTNILIHREATTVVRDDIGVFFKWLDKLQYRKFVHPLSVNEIKKHADPVVVRTFEVKIQSYELLRTCAEDTASIATLRDADQTDNDSVGRCCMNSIGCILVECCFLVSCFFLPYTTGVCPDGSCD